MASRARELPKGISRRVVARLKKTCITAIWAMGPATVASIRAVRGVTITTTVKITVPITLNSTWTQVARLASRLTPTEAITAVMQVPMFWPNRI